MTLEFNKAVQIINHLRQLKKPIIWGGIHATSVPDECIQYADIVCIGEGEEAVCELARALTEGTDFSNIKNLWFRQNGHVKKNPVRPLIQNLDALPFPDYDFNSHYVLENGSIKRAGEYYRKLEVILVHTTRGCPLNCSYCCNSLLQRIYDNKNRVVRRMGVETILKELEWLKGIFPKLVLVWFTDDTFFIRPAEELKSFANEYKKRIALPFQCYTTPDTLTVEKLETLLDAGLIKVEMGIQTGSENTNKNVYFRNIPNSRVMKTAQLINQYMKHVVPPSYQLIFQNPYENENDLVETINFLRGLPPPFLLQVFQLTWFPGTQLYERAKREGMLSSYAVESFIDYRRGFDIQDREKYLNFLIFMISGYTKPSKIGRIGKIPRFILPILMSNRMIDHFKRHPDIINFLIRRYFELVPFPQQIIKRYWVLSKVALQLIPMYLWKRTKYSAVPQ